jgi:hypothetical protein
MRAFASRLPVAPTECRRTDVRCASRLFAAAAVAMLGVANIDFASAQTQRIDGDVESVDASTLQLRAKSGEAVAVSLDGAVRYSARSPATLADIVPGVYVATTAILAQDGTLTAVELRIFAESMRGTGEGHRPLAGPPGGTMTNSMGRTVDASGAASGTTMTSAGVAGVSNAASGRRLTLAYAGGEKVLLVPESTPIERQEPADRSALAPGAHVIVFGTRGPGGGFVAERVNIGKNGYVPIR